jgi:hypothetical protein
MTTPPHAARLRLSWPTPTAAAAFVRGDDLWLVFDQPSAPGLDHLRRAAGETHVAAVERLPHPRATVLRLSMARPGTPRLTRDGLAWVVALADATAPPPATPAVVPRADDGDPALARLRLPMALAGEPIAFTDPADGAPLIVVPVAEPGRRLARGYDFRQFRLLPTAQGVAVTPKADGLTVRALPDAVEVSRAGGLALTPVPATLAAVVPLSAAPAVSRLIPRHAWPAADLQAVAGRQAAWHRAVASPLAADRDAGEATLARFYIATGLHAEALGVLQQQVALRPERADDPAVRLLFGVARLGLGRAREAVADLDRPSVRSTDEGALWLALARTAAADGPADAAGDRASPLAADRAALPRWTTLVASYPPPLGLAAGLPLLDALVTAGAPEATTLAAGLAAVPGDPAVAAALAYQDGRLKAATGDVDGALAAWAASPTLARSRPAVEAAFAEVETLHRAGRLSAADAAAALARLQATWRGDDLEFRLLDRQGQLAAAAGAPLMALEAWRDALGRFPESRERPRIAGAMADLFVAAMTDGTIERMPPWQAVALYEGFKELVPAEAAGHPVRLAYARRLMAADLPQPAAEALVTALKLPLAAADRAVAGRLLAACRLAAGDPDAALAALAASDHDPLPADVAEGRRLIAARARLAKGEPDRARALLAGQPGAAAAALRLAIGRGRADWTATAAELAGGAASSSPGHALDLAAAQALAGDRTGDAGPAAAAAAGPPPAEAEAARLLARPQRPLAPRPEAIADLVGDGERLAAVARQVAATPPAAGIAPPPAAPAVAGPP